jgi:hypothetical protein
MRSGPPTLLASGGRGPERRHAGSHPEECGCVLLSESRQRFDIDKKRFQCLRMSDSLGKQYELSCL